MNIETSVFESERRTTADDVFDRLHSDIVNLRLLPGAKLSEVDVARQSDVSRQPVREAFIRLNNMSLVQVRPQKATRVCKISIRDILNARFIRTAVEVEVVRRACAAVNAENLLSLEANLARQKAAIAENGGNRFHDLDYEFHRLMCLAANCEFAFKTIAENKSHVDRLCLLSLANAEDRSELYQDHSNIFKALVLRDEAAIVELTRIHFLRLDVTLANAREKYGHYFED